MNINETFHTWKEKLLGNIGSVGVIVVAATVLYKALPTLNSFLDMMIGTASRLVQLSVYGIILILFFSIVLHPRFWTLMWHIREMIMNGLSKALLRADPIGRLRSFADDYLDVLRSRFNNAKSVVEAQLSKIQGKITEQENVHERKSREAEMLKRNHYRDGKWDSDVNQNNFRLASQEVAFAEDTLKELRKLEEMLRFSVTVLDKVGNALDYRIRLARRTADTLEMRYEATQSTRKALATAAEAWGAGDKARFDQMTRDYIEGQINGNIGVISTYLKALPELTSFADIQGEMASDTMMQRLRELESVADTAFSETEVQQSMLASGDVAKALSVNPKQRELVPARRYTGLLEKR
jgi:hypothetical protein